jgi:hypothetical protein
MSTCLLCSSTVIRIPRRGRSELQNGVVGSPEQLCFIMRASRDGYVADRKAPRNRTYLDPGELY